MNTLIDAKAEDDLARRDALLEELRGLANAHPEDPAVRAQLARSLPLATTGSKSGSSYYNRS